MNQPKPPPVPPPGTDAYADQVPAGYDREGWEETKAFNRHRHKPPAPKAPPLVPKPKPQ